MHLRVSETVQYQEQMTCDRGNGTREMGHDSNRPGTGERAGKWDMIRIDRMGAGEMDMIQVKHCVDPGRLDS